MSDREETILLISGTIYLKESKFWSISGEAKHFHTIEDSDENKSNGSDTFFQKKFSLGLSIFLG